MKISFESSKIETLFHNERKLKGKYDSSLVKKIKVRLASLEAAQNLAVYKTTDASCHELINDRRGQIAINLTSAMRLIIRPENPTPYKEDGGLDWMRVDRIVIIEIVDYH